MICHLMILPNTRFQFLPVNLEIHDSTLGNISMLNGKHLSATRAVIGLVSTGHVVFTSFETID